MPDTLEQRTQLQAGVSEAPVEDLAPLEPAQRNAPALQQPQASGAPTDPAALATRVRLQVEQTSAEAPEQVDALLEALANLATSPGRPTADLLLGLLEERRLEGLEDARGRTARATAVEALLGMGYPYALEVSPEDLEHLRARSRDVPLSLRIGAVCLVLALSGLQALTAVVTQEPPSLFHAVGTVTAVLLAASTRPGSRLRRWAWGALLAAGLLGVGLQLPGVLPPSSLLPSLAAFIAAAMMFRKR